MTPRARNYDRTCKRCSTEFKAARPSARYCSDYCRKRACADRCRAICESCGDPMSPGSSNHHDRPYRLCQKCYANERRAAVAIRDRQLEQWWADGLTQKEIAERLGWSRDHVSVELDGARSRGADLPYRRQPTKPKFSELAA